MSSLIRRASISLKRAPALVATRVCLNKSRLVYVFVADRPLRYPAGFSRIAYIGTTKTGVNRISASIAKRAEVILSLHGVQSFDARVLTCRPRQKVKMWFALERALIVTFRERFGDVPRCNKKGTKMTLRRSHVLFHRTRLERLIADLS